MSATTPLPATDPRAAAGSLALQVAASMLPVPLSWLYVAMGVGCAVLVHTEVDMCGKRKQRLARARTRARRTEPESEPALEQDRCWVSRWCSPSSTSSATTSATQHPPTEASEGAAEAEFCLVRTIQGCLNHRRRRQDVGADDETWQVAAPTTFDFLPSSEIATSQSLHKPVPRTVEEADEELASVVLPQVSHLASAMDHLRFKVDSLLVWKRSIQSQLVGCVPDPDAPAASASTAAAVDAAANVTDLRI